MSSVRVVSEAVLDDHVLRKLIVPLLRRQELHFLAHTLLVIATSVIGSVKAWADKCAITEDDCRRAIRIWRSLHVFEVGQDSRIVVRLGALGVLGTVIDMLGRGLLWVPPGASYITNVKGERQVFDGPEYHKYSVHAASVTFTESRKNDVDSEAGFETLAPSVYHKSASPDDPEMGPESSGQNDRKEVEEGLENGGFGGVAIKRRAGARGSFAINRAVLSELIEQPINVDSTVVPINYAIKTTVCPTSPKTGSDRTIAVVSESENKNKTTKRTRRKFDPNKEPEILAVWTYWRDTLYPAQTRKLPGHKEAGHIRARLKGGFTAADLRAVVDWAKQDNWMSGRSPRATRRYDLIETLFRSDDKTRQYLDAARFTSSQSPTDALGKDRSLAPSDRPIVARDF